MINFLTQFAVALDVKPLPFNDGTSDYGKIAWTNGLTIVFGLFAAVALLMIIINGFLYITAAGDPQRMAQARQGLLYAVIGLVVILLAGTIVTFVIKAVA